MCGRFNLVIPPQVLADTFATENVFAFDAQYNIAPSEDLVAIRSDSTAKRRLVLLRWGFIPPWMKKTEISGKYINARVETAYKLPLFKHAFQYQRCIIPASSFFEWQPTARGKQPYLIHRPDNSPLAFAGLWSHWENQGQTIESGCILTQDATGAAANIHTRMPVILSAPVLKEWLDPDLKASDHLITLLQSNQPPDLVYYPVSPKVNNPRFKAKICVEPVFA